MCEPGCDAFGGGSFGGGAFGGSDSGVSSYIDENGNRVFTRKGGCDCGAFGGKNGGCDCGAFGGKIGGKIGGGSFAKNMNMVLMVILVMIVAYYVFGKHSAKHAKHAYKHAKHSNKHGKCNEKYM